MTTRFQAVRLLSTRLLLLALCSLFTSSARAQTTPRYSVKPAASDAIIYVSVSNGLDSNDGLSRGSPKKTLTAAKSQLETNTAGGGLVGGTIVLMGNSTSVLTSTLSLGNGSTIGEVIKPEGRLIIQCNITNGTACIDIFSGSGIDCGMHGINNCMIDTFSSSTNVSTLVETDPANANETVILNGVEIRDSHSATVTDALLSIPTAYDSDLYGDVVTSANGEISTHLGDGTALLCSNNLNFYNFQSAQDFSTGALGGAQSVLIKPTHGCSIGPINFFGGDFNGHHLPATGHIVEVDGNGATTSSIQFYAIYEEGNPTSDTGSLNFVNGNSTTGFHDFDVNRLFGSGSSYGFELNNAIVGNVFSFYASGFVTGGTSKNAVLNDITSTNSQHSNQLEYHYSNLANGGTEFIGNSVSASTAALISSGGGTITHQAPNTAATITVTDPVATTLTPVVGTCTMTTTTCTVTVVSGATHCIVTDNSASHITGGCAISGTTLTVTAASSNTDTWAVLWW